MVTESSLWLAVPVLFVIVDNLVQVACLGFYHQGLYFDVHTLEEQLFFTQGVDLLKSGFEFVLLAFLRLCLLSTGIFLIYRRLSLTIFNYVYSVFYMLTLSYALTKVLLFSEYEEQLKFPGVWLSIWSTFAMATTHFSLWFFYVQKKKKTKQEDEGYTRMAENGHVQGLQSGQGEAPAPEATVPAAPEPNVQSTSPESPTEKPKLDRATVMEQVAIIFKFTALHWKWFAGGFVFLLIYSSARIFIPYYTGQVIAEIVGAQGRQEHDFMRLILIMIGLTALSTIFGGLRGGFFTYATYLVNYSMRRDLFRSIVRQEIAFFDKAQTGEVISRLSADCQTVSSTVSTNVNIFMRNIVMLIGSLIFMFVLSWRLTLITFIAIPPIALITKIYGSYFDKLSEKTQETIAEANRVAEEAVGSMRTVRSFACEIKEALRFEERLDNTLVVSKKKAIAYLGYAWINELAENIILVAVLFYAGHLAMKGQLTVNQVTSFLLYQMQLGENFYSINYVFSGLMESVGASRKVFEYMNREPAIKYEGQVETPIKGEVQFESVSFAYPTRASTEVLKNLTINIQAGQTVALVGPSGAGKSSVIALLEHFYETNAGRILVDGIDITQYKHSYYHQQVSLVSQEPVLYSGTIRYNILYGCEQWANDSHMIDAAKLANAHDFISELDHGYDTKCGEKGVQMSGGQKQRIAIARALVRNPSVLILDEATSALDSESEHIIQKALQQAAVGRTVIVIAHRLSTVENSDCIYVINKGQVVQSGNHRKLMGEEGLYKVLVQRQLMNSETSEDTTSTTA